MMKRKLILISTMFLLFVFLVIAGSLNIATHTKVDFGVMSPKEVKTMSYYMKGYYEDEGNYYSVCVKHPIEGEIKNWIRLKLDETDNLNIYDSQKCSKNKRLNQHWVGPELEVTWIKNIHVTLKIPPKAKQGNYTVIVNNIGCMSSSATVNFCNSVPTKVLVEVVR